MLSRFNWSSLPHFLMPLILPDVTETSSGEKSSVDVYQPMQMGTRNLLPMTNPSIKFHLRSRGLSFRHGMQRGVHLGYRPKTAMVAISQ